MRENDYAFRMGGDEFLILLPETNEEQAYHLAERMRKEIEHNTLQSYFKIRSKSLASTNFID